MGTPVPDDERLFYLVSHLRPDTEPDGMIKHIGLFDSPEVAQSVVEAYGQMEGFSRYPEGFTIETFRLNQRRWRGGFFSPLDEPDQ
jgi:hypothetical protein